MASRFVHLHTHSHYSLLTALPKIDDLVKKTKDCGMDALALTDNGNLYGAIEFYKTCKKAGVKPIIGIDAYVAARTRNDKQGALDSRRTRLLLLAKNYEGYKNLIKLVTDSHLEGFYYKPRIDKELIEKYNTGLVCISPSFSGAVSAALKMKDYDKAKELIAWYKEVYGADNFFLELTHHPEIENHQSLMDEVKKIATETATPLVAAHDVYYLEPEDRPARETLMQVMSGGESNEKSNFDDDSEDFSFISSEKAEEYFKDCPEALDNCRKVADMCNLELELGKWVFPNYIVESGLSYDDELKRIVYEGIGRRGLKETPELRERVEYELKVIKDKGYAPYFLVVSDLLRYAHENDILTTIRGSVAGSMVTYLAHITNVDPMEYKLPFERFLNPERPSAPDIDMDYADNRRDEMIAYAKRKYGEDKVAQIGTFGTMMAKGAVRDVARAMGYPYAVGDKISKLIPMGAQGFPMTIDRALNEVAELKELYENDADTRKIIDMAKKIEGCARHMGVHAAGVVIAPQPLTDFAALQFDSKGDNKIITQFDMHAVEDAGLLKFDFLGIKNLAILADAVKMARKATGKNIRIESVPIDDLKTFEMLAKGETIGLFQLNGAGMTRYLKELKPTTIHDINAMVALYRPGPMESIPQYVERKHNPDLVKYLDPRLKDILNQSYGVITYQDDVMLIAIKLGGYSWLEADKLRKAMGKKIPKEMEEQKGKLREGLLKNGLSEKKADQLWKLIEPFAAYGFNKCLSGQTRLTDAITGERFSIEELYKSKKTPSLHTLGENFKLTHKRITAVAENGIKPVYELTTRSGRTITSTDNHPFYTFSGWEELKYLKTGMRIAVPRKLEVKEGSSGEDYKAAVLGYLISEGNLCHPHGIYYYSTNELEIADFIRNAEQFSNTHITIDRSKSAAAVYIGQKKKTGNELFNWIKEVGLYGKKATQKHVPQWVYALQNNTLAIFIAKLWQGDGTVSIKSQQLFYATSSVNLAHDVQHLLLRFGILSTIHTKQFKYRYGIKTGYTVYVTHRDNIIAFSSQIAPHMLGDKKAKILELAALSASVVKTSSYPARGTKDTIPSEILSVIRESMKQMHATVSSVSIRTGISKRMFSFDSYKKGYQRNVIELLGKSLNSHVLLSHAGSDIYWDEIVSIEYKGEEMTYDLTIPPHHNFVANDIIVHNSHAASYGRVAYQTAYMKANYPAIYMAAVLTADSGDVEKIGEIITECKRMQIPVLPPDINESYSGFTVVQFEGKDAIRFGLTTIKNFGQGIGESIISEREQNGKYQSLSNFLDRIKDRNLNKKSLEALIKSGAMDAFGERGQMLANIEDLLKYNKEKTKGAENQDSLFGAGTLASISNLRMHEAPPASKSDMLLWEKELLGLYVSGHPLDKFREILDKRDMNIKKAKETLKDGAVTVIAGIIEEAKNIVTKKGDNMMFLKISDFSGSLEAVVFPRTFAEFKNLLQPERCIAVKGKMSERNGTQSMIAEKIKGL